jgi:hypothetical protein
MLTSCVGLCPCRCLEQRTGTTTLGATAACGEQTEQVWAQLNKFVASTRNMTPRNRLIALNLLLADQNERMNRSYFLGAFPLVAAPTLLCMVYVYCCGQCVLCAWLCFL